MTPEQEQELNDAFRRAILEQRDTARREVYERDARITELEAVALQAREAIRANLTYATRKDEQVLLAAFTAIDAVLDRKTR